MTDQAPGTNAIYPWMGPLPTAEFARHRLEAQEQRVRAVLMSIAEALRRSAVNVDRIALRAPADYDPGENIIDSMETVMSGLFNMHLEQLVREYQRVEMWRAVLAATTNGQDGFRPYDHG